jgi:hypothetical protein
MSGFGRQRLNAVSGSGSELTDSDSENVPKKRIGGFGNFQRRPSESDNSDASSENLSIVSSNVDSDSENSTPPNSPSKSSKRFGTKKKNAKGIFFCLELLS